MRSSLIRLSLIALVTSLAIPAYAAPDCAPLGHLPNYIPANKDAAIRDYETYEFRAKKGDDEEIVTPAGRWCYQTYSIKVGVDPLSNIEIQRNYRDQLEKAGATITATGGRDLYATINKNGQETWLRVYGDESSIEITVLQKMPHKQTLVAPSGLDYRLLGHMPNYKADPPQKKNFDSLEVKITDGDNERLMTVEGTKYVVTYALKEGVVPNANIDIQTNYKTALAALGAETLFASPTYSYSRFENNGQSIWVRIYCQENSIEVFVIEEKALQLSVKAPDAGALKSILDKDGRIALYVNFDFNKATLKPDAAPVIAQIVKLLKDNPTLKISIDGHTDNVGGHDYNVKLSEARAAAVVAAVAAQGIAKERMASSGFGPDKPVDDNNKPEGRAKNRRVELVKS